MALFNALPNPCSGALLLSHVNDGAEGRIDEAGRAPLASQAIEICGQRVRARIEVELKFSVEPGIEFGWRDPVVLPVVTIAYVELVFRRVKLALMRLRHAGKRGECDGEIGPESSADG